jgi:trimeric autotransporter adhesin
MVVADAAYATNSIIYALPATAGAYVQTWTIGSTATAWTNVGATTTNANEVPAGLAIVGGNIYALSANATSSTLYQYIPSVRAWANVIVAANLQSAASPNSLETSTSTGALKLWAVKATASATIYQVVDTIGVAGPVITGPADKTSVTASNGVSNVVILTWNRVANATTSTVQVAFDTAFTQTLTTYTVNFPTLNQVVARDALVAGTTFYWRVRASAPLNSPYSEVRSLTVQALPASVPAISSPTNGATILSQSPAFSWTPVTGTTKYDFQLSTTPTFGTTVLTDQPASSGTLVPVTIKLDQGKQYFWRVRALEPVVGDWSAVANFIVAVPATTTAPVVITQVPAPVITIPAAPSVPAITLAPAPVNQIAPTYIWAIIIIGAILVIAVIVLIVRTRRSV